MRTLITAKELKNEMLTIKNLIILDCRFYLTDLDKGYKEYKKGHIDGAYFVDVHKELAGTETEHTGRHPLPPEDYFASFLAKIGVNYNSTVVVYDDMSGAIASRMWWMLSQNNIDARVLDGGLPMWLELGESLSDKNSIPVKVDKIKICFPWAIDESEVLNNIEKNSFKLLDARAVDRFTGENETMDPIGGHIPGASNHFFGENLAKNGCFLPAEELTVKLPTSNSNTPFVHYCGSGITACHNVLAYAIAGRESLHVYVGSWSQWSKRMMAIS